MQSNLIDKIEQKDEKPNVKEHVYDLFQNVRKKIENDPKYEKDEDLRKAIASIANSFDKAKADIKAD